MRKRIWGGIAFVAGAIVQIILDRFVNWSANILPTVFPVSLSDILLIVGLIVGGSLIAVGIWKSRLGVKRIDDVQAFIFWPKGTLVENKTLDYHRKHFNKKLIVNFKMNPPEAYYLVASKTSYGWRLIETYSDLYTSVEDSTYPNPDIESWCTKKGYHLNTYSASQEDLERSLVTLNGTGKNAPFEPFFEAEIKDKKKEYHQGDFVLFRTRFRGELTHGFFHNRITHSENKKFHHGRYLNRKKSRAYSWPSDTLSLDSWWIPARYLKGMLNGYVNKTSEWCYGIPFDAPLGEYRIAMRVFNRTKPPAIILRQKEDTIIVVA